ncbi:MAG: SemiSWEET transporter [Balneolaceae bacterium]
MPEITSITWLGLLAATLTTCAFVPQVWKTWKSGSAKDLSLGTFSILGTGVFLWLVYGLMINDLPITLANLITFVLVITLVVLKLTFKERESREIGKR